MESEASIHNMLSCINKKRKEMVGLAETYGYTDEHTLKCSQELDELINEFYRLTGKKKYRNFLVFEMSHQLEEKDVLLIY